MLSIFKKKESLEAWNKSFAHLHPDTDLQKVDSNQLRLILGVGRSGTSWLANVLSQSESKIRYVHEGYPHFIPKPILSKKFDPNSVGYLDRVDTDHPLVKINTTLLSKDLNADFFINEEYFRRKIKRNDPSFEFVLHKEVHSLLATEALIKHFRTPSVVITRNPVYVVDSLFTYLTIDDSIWRSESLLIQNENFYRKFFSDSESAKIDHYLRKYPDDGKNRQNTILGKCITVGVINKMMTKIGHKHDNVIHVKYEELTKEPLRLFPIIAEFLNLKFENKSNDFLKATLNQKSTEFKPMSIYKDTKNQANRNLRFLTQKEYERANDVLSSLGLI